MYGCVILFVGKRIKMKYLFCLLVIFFSGFNVWAQSDSDVEGVFKACMKPAVAARNEYWESVKYRQFGRDNLDWDSLTETEKIEYRTRNSCIADFQDVYLNCEFYKCLQERGKEEHFVVLFLSPQLTGEEICNYQQNVDCFNDDISVVKNFVSGSGGMSSELFGLNMNSVISDIKEGKRPDLAKVDTNNEICWLADNNGDTVWHALAAVDNDDFFSFANMCISILNDQRKEYLYDSAFFNKNKQGKTAVMVALETDNINRFSIFGQYFKQEGINCSNMLDYAAAEAGVDKTDISVLCPVY